MGLAYDLKRATPETIARYKYKYGDPEAALPKLPPWLDWTIGLLVSALPLWIIVISRFLYLMFAQSVF